jgi:myo-inositol-hexaphosphate 3-phosphohydrolase
LVEALKEQNSRINYLENKIKDSQLKKASSDEFNEMATSDAMLKQNRPNPFSENTEIEFYLPSTVQKAMLNIYDLQGKQVKSMNIAEREYGNAVIYGSELQPGMYHYSLIADGEVIGVEKMILTD